MILAMANKYLGGQGHPHDPLASPLYADLAGLPPLLIQVGDRETVLNIRRCSLTWPAPPASSSWRSGTA